MHRQASRNSRGASYGRARRLGVRRLRDEGRDLADGREGEALEVLVALPVVRLEREGERLESGVLACARCVTLAPVKLQSDSSADAGAYAGT